MQATPYTQCSQELQRLVAAALFAEWSTDFALQGVTNAEQCRDLFLKNYADWKSTRAVLFVLTDPRVPGAPFVGTASLEYTLTSAYSPCIANVFVHPSLRGYGFGKLLMSFAEKYLKKSKMTAAYLWCDPGLVGFYEKRGYKVVDSPTGSFKEVRFMGKSL
jgi:GNAT superfamily N-acetyltransferase